MWPFISANGQIQCWSLQLSLSCKAADVPKAEQPAGGALQTQGQFRGWPEHSILYQQFQGISKAAQNTVGIFFDLIQIMFNLVNLSSLILVFFNRNIILITYILLW